MSIDIGRLSIFTDTYGIDQWWHRWQAWVPYATWMIHRQLWFFRFGVLTVMYRRKQQWERDGSGPPMIVTRVK